MDKFTRKTSFEQWFTQISSTKLEELVNDLSIKLLYKEATHRFILEITRICTTQRN